MSQQNWLETANLTIPTNLYKWNKSKSTIKSKVQFSSTFQLWSNCSRLHPRRGDIAFCHHKRLLSIRKCRSVCIQTLPLDTWHCPCTLHRTHRRSPFCDRKQNTSWCSDQSTGIGRCLADSPHFPLDMRLWFHFDGRNRIALLRYRTYLDRLTDIVDQLHSSIPMKSAHRPNRHAYGFLCGKERKMSETHLDQHLDWKLDIFAASFDGCFHLTYLDVWK